MSQDQARVGRGQAKGELKEEVGGLAGDRSIEWSGKFDQVADKVEQKPGEVKDTRRFADGRVRTP